MSYLTEYDEFNKTNPHLMKDANGKSISSFKSEESDPVARKEEFENHLKEIDDKASSLNDKGDLVGADRFRSQYELEKNTFLLEDQKKLKLTEDTIKNTEDKIRYQEILIRDQDKEIYLQKQSGELDASKITKSNKKIPETISEVQDERRAHDFINDGYGPGKLTPEELRKVELSDPNLRRSENGEAKANYSPSVFDKQDFNKDFLEHTSYLKASEDKWNQRGDSDMAGRYKDQRVIEESAYKLEYQTPSKFDSRQSAAEKQDYEKTLQTYHDTKDSVRDRDVKMQNSQNVTQQQSPEAVKNSVPEDKKEAEKNIAKREPETERFSDKDSYKNLDNYKVGDTFEIEKSPHRSVEGVPTSSLSRGDKIQVTEVQNDRILVNRNGKEFTLNVSQNGDRLKMTGNEALKEYPSENLSSKPEDKKETLSTPQRRPGLLSSEEVKAQKAQESKTLENKNPIKAHKIDGYKSEVKDGRVDYKDKTDKLAFSDSGSKIRVADSRDELAIKGSLQLASSKYDRFKIQGSDEAKQKICDVAHKEGISRKITNPEMKDYIKNLDSQKLESQKAKVESPQEVSKNTHTESEKGPTIKPEEKPVLKTNEPVKETNKAEITAKEAPTAKEEKPMSAAGERNAAAIAERAKTEPTTISPSFKAEMMKKRESNEQAQREAIQQQQKNEIKPQGQH